MEYRRVGNSNLRISELSLGAWLTYAEKGEKVARECIRAAFEAGVNSFDNADVYGKGRAETIMGTVLKNLRRSDLIIASKVFYDMAPGPNDRGLSRKHIMESCDGSLRRLNTDYLDIYYFHGFESEQLGVLNPNMEEAVRAMDDLVRQGKILYWAVSNWDTAQIARAWGLADKWMLYKPVAVQPEYHMFQRSPVETDLGRLAGDLGFGLMTYSPLNHGILTGKYNDGIPADSRFANPHHEWRHLRRSLTQEKIDRVRKLTKVAEGVGGTVTQLAIAWLLRLPQVSSVIVGASSLSQVEENLKSLELKNRLTPDVLERIENILGNKPQLAL
jgi:voltage-dependent potassium channel beta subunit